MCPLLYNIVGRGFGEVNGKLAFICVCVWGGGSSGGGGHSQQELLGEGTGMKGVGICHSVCG